MGSGVRSGTAGVKLFNAGMRGQKNTPWLGGTRAASFWRWPGTLKAGGVGRLAAHIDVFPSLAEIAGAARAWTLAHDADWTAEQFDRLYHELARA